MKTAIIHYWLLKMGGGENVLESLLDIFPQASIYTHIYSSVKISSKINKQKIHTTFIQHLPCVNKYYKWYLPLMPIALEQLNLEDYDLIISCESGPAKGVIVPSHSKHICYCHTPMRYLWEMHHFYYKATPKPLRPLMAILAHYLRIWDVSSASRVDHFIANSQNVAQRIKKYYHREATIIYPPVKVDKFYISKTQEDYYLYVGRLVKYKNIEIAIRAFNQLKKRFIIIGEGEEYSYLKSIAEPNIIFLGRINSQELKHYYAKAKALIFPGEEDFGIVLVESMASGRPVIAYKKGGALEIVKENHTGLFFSKPSPESLIEAVLKFEQNQNHFSPPEIKKFSNQFSDLKFKDNFIQFLKKI